MFVRTVSEVIGTSKEHVGKGFKSRRLVVKDDALPMSVHETTLEAGIELRFCYVNHSETVYCIEGAATLENMATGEKHKIAPGTLYSVVAGDDHLVKTETPCKLICIFEPPLSGDEMAD